ncbi:type II toxin-antitoxin system RelE/ParE family toxin [Vineibacter terrae]|uniref:Type II toxin-antitoxin system RelE/ParE family toxin n=1 Tax=Vineibacter terrae TaxID=2586908 RepID=A0A5C8P751_9HYPH|nr:type II toxin-antitoxin system RelE/ParE family toxin [Vineibacter terrae]TXL69521.1 type II toxin-antitoxin system RelE/ParE family toxin [Vineibacter terrae]
MEVRWLRGALVSLNREIDYIAARNPDAAKRIANRIESTVQRLSASPESGRPGRIAGTRELVVSGTPYIVPYRIRASRVEIIRVFHGMRRWPDTF